MIYLSDYLSNLVYDSVKIYSYNRGDIHQKYLQKLIEEKETLKEKLDTETDWDIQIKLSKRIKTIKNYNSLRDPLSNQNGQLHPTSRILKEFKKQDIYFVKLKDILNRSTHHPIASRCIEEFRDGISFFQNGQFIKSLSICFSCVFIKDSAGQIIYADDAFYKEYKAFLLVIGHDVNEK